MKGIENTSPALAPGHRILSEDLDYYGESLAVLIVKRAIEGHFAFFKLLLDKVDGPDNRHGDDERVIEPSGPLIVMEDPAEPGRTTAAGLAA